MGVGIAMVWSRGVLALTRQPLASIALRSKAVCVSSVGHSREVPLPAMRSELRPVIRELTADSAMTLLAVW